MIKRIKGHGGRPDRMELVVSAADTVRVGAVASVLSVLVLQKVPSEANPKVRNHGEGPY